MNQGIYAIINTESNKCYIGSAVNLRKRWAQHKTELRKGRHDNPHLQSVWNKYGENVFSFITCEYIENQDCLIEREQYWLDEFKLLCPVYNYGTVARHPMLGRHPSEETCRKLSKALTGRQYTKETRRKMSEASKGKHHSEETRAKLVTIGARFYPTFHNKSTGEVIPAGINLKALCKERNLGLTSMRMVKIGNQHQYKGWELDQHSNEAGN